MAKKARGEFNMSQAIRDVLQENPGMSGREVLEALKSKHPGQSINENSFGVAFWNARRKLGIKTRRGRRKVRVRTPGMAGRRAAAAPTSGGAIDFDLLQAARKYLSIAKDTDTAIQGLKQLQALQIGS